MKLIIINIDLFLLIITSYQHGAAAAAMGSLAPERPICLYYLSNKVQSHSDNDQGGDQLLGDGTVLCASPTDYCFSFWNIAPVNEASNDSMKMREEEIEVTASSPGFSWLARGCFKNADMCHQEKCVANEKEVENNFFCCCKGSRCNEKISFLLAPIQPEAAHSDSDGQNHDQFSASSYILLSCIFFIAFVGFGAFVFVKRKRNRKSLADDAQLGLDKSPTSPCIDLNNLKFLEEIGHGRYGKVRRAMLGGEEVAVKLFLQHHKSSFSNEKYIYSLPLMEHQNLLTFLGGGEITGPDGNAYHGLVLSYCPLGKLSSFLQHNTLDWTTFCRVVTSAVKALGHLHSELRKGDLIKPCVAHRDFNTRNILLKNDMSCVVSDLGFAIHTQGAKFYINGEEQLAEMASLTDVGTMRYMAPEVLEGAVNLRDCETSLKQIDIYALGLVLWEVARRCHELYQGTLTPDYALPFQAEIGLNPSFEQMQVLVARNKARPLFHPMWKDSNPAIRQLKETIEDCWDNDAEARLSAMCVEKRLQELKNLWERYKVSLGVNGISPSTNPHGGSLMAGAKSSDCNSFIISNELSLPKDKYNQHRESNVSENTCETTIPFSPSDPNGRILGKNHYVEAVQVFLPQMLQPHQGRNPCLERNTINEMSLEPKATTNRLIEASDKFPINKEDVGLTNANLVEVLEAQHGIDSNMLMNEHLVPLLNSFLPASQQAPPIVHSAPPPLSLPVVPPIPYLQNETKFECRPKQQNLPKVLDKKVENSKGWRRWKAAWEERLMVFLPRRHHRYESEDEEQQNILITPSSNSFSEPPTPLAPFYSITTLAHPLQTQVNFSSGGPQTVISDRVVNHPISAPLNTHLNISPTPITSSPLVTETEIGIAKLQFQHGLTPIIRSRQGSKDSGINKSSSDTSSATSYFIDSDSSLDKVRRPTTLLIQNVNKNLRINHNSDDDIGSDAEKESSSSNQIKLRKPKQRIKTPRAAPINPRLSLYDDSIMGGNHGTSLLESTISRSLPLDINTVGKGVNRNSSNAGDKSSISFSSNIKQSGSSNSTSSGHSTSESGSVCQKDEFEDAKVIKSIIGGLNSPLVAHV